MNRNWHIAFLHKEFPFGGAEKMTHATANYLCNHSCRVSVLTTKHNRHLYPQGSERFFNVVLLPERNIKLSGAVAHAIHDFIINNHVHVLVTSRELLYAKWLKARTGIKIIYQLHSSPYYENLDIEEKKAESRLAKAIYNSGLQWLSCQFYRDKYHRIYRWADAYGVLCDSYKKVIMDELHLNTNNKVWVLPNSIERPKSIEWKKQKTIIYVGRLSYRDKRVDRLLRIWGKAQPQMPGWTLKIIGEGREMDNLRNQAAALHLHHLSFEGQTNDVDRYYNEAAMLCLTSSFEGWPMSVAEAQSHGVVPVVFDSFLGAKDQITTEEEGLRITPYDEVAFAKALVHLSNDNERLTRMSRRVVEKSRMYSTSRTGEAWIRMLSLLLT